MNNLLEESLAGVIDFVEEWNIDNQQLYVNTVLQAIYLHDCNIKNFRESVPGYNNPFIELRLGRALGATTLIKDLASENDVVIVHNIDLKKNMSESTKAKVLTVNNLYRNLHRGIRADNVWIDSPTELNKFEIRDCFPTAERIIYL